MEVLWIFRDVESAAQAVQGLIGEGFAERQITSLSSVAYPDGVLVSAGAKGWFRQVTLAGALTGACAGFLLAAGTAWLYPVQTGDKPIIALFPTGIVTFEVTMLCAIIGTMLGMFLEMRLPARKAGLYDPEIAEGAIGISVTFTPPGGVAACGADAEHCIALLSIGEQRQRAEAIMKRAGALRSVTE